MLGKLFGRGSDDGVATPRKKRDKAIIHETVPDEVLFPEGKTEESVDTSWMNEVLPEAKSPPKAEAPASIAEGEARAASEPRPARPSVSPPPARRSIPQKPAQDAAPSAAAAPTGPSNPEAGARPRFPVGWLVVVEGSDTGAWFPLESGVSAIGSGEGQTVRIGNDDAVAGDRHAVIGYDEAGNAFSVAAGGAEAVRLNGAVVTSAERLRDGDVLSVGGTALKLVALCAGNFRWSDTDRSR